MVSHELRTPLSGILAAGEQLRRAPLEPAQRQAAEVVLDAGRFMHVLLNDLLDLAKLEAGKMSVEAIAFDIGELVLALEHHWKAAAERAGKPLQLTAAYNLPLCVRGDPTRLRQVLNNLLSNALKFTGPEGVTWAVEVVDDGSLCWMTFRVTDTGPGLSPERLERLFTPFDQTDVTVARTHGGTGLGLALSRELARLMAGELRVESQLGVGSTFILSVPLTRIRSEARDEADVPAVPSLAGLRVLVVDDHEINRRTAALILEAAGMEPTLAASGAEALALLDAQPFDAVITDVKMPDMNGLQLTREINRRVGLNRFTPVIAFTAADSPEEQAACRAAGMRACISKPLDARALYRAVAEACAGRPPARDRADVA
jgi:CheY-like chemotaxis protein